MKKYAHSRNMTLVKMCGVVICASAFSASVNAQFDTGFSNQGGITNTRHNMTFSSLNNGNGTTAMDTYLNAYEEVCVYCHTPHGANDAIAAPLWNRTYNNPTYELYAALGTSSLDGAQSYPGVNSLMCLSCHDGTLPIDSIVNMPGSNRISSTQKTSVDKAFLDSWENAGSQVAQHRAFAIDGSVPPAAACTKCHDGIDRADFKMAVIGTDLRDEHPVGVQLPLAQLGEEFIAPDGAPGGMRFYDLNEDGRAQTNEIRYYDTGGGDGPEVECASCHDPHGVWTDAARTDYAGNFLRVKNEGSAVCLACHIK